jgi:hypothetical protein
VCVCVLIEVDSIISYFEKSERRRTGRGLTFCLQLMIL